MPKEEPYWWEDAGMPEAPPEAPLPAEADAVVIGAGLTGLSAARTLARSGRSVVVLEAGAPGIGASSRNGGMIGGGHRLSPAETEARFGAEVAGRLLREAHLESYAFCRGLMEDESIDCDFRETGRFRGFWRAGEYEAEARTLERLQRTIPIEAEMVPQARQREQVASDLYRGGVVYHRHGGLNPAKWLRGLLAAAERAGALVQGHSPVTAVTREAGRPGHTVTTPRGDIRAGHVLAATNGYSGPLFPALRRRIVPVPSFIVTTEPLGQNRVRDLFPSGRMIVESRLRHCYYRPSPDGTRIVFGGRAAMTELPERFTTAELGRLLAEVFPDLGPVAFSHAWRGRTGFTFDFLPHVGEIDGVWHAMGYSGSGNAMAPWLGHKAALGMMGDPEGETAFSRTGFPTRWWHRGPAWFLPFADLAFRAKDVAGSVGRR